MLHLFLGGGVFTYDPNNKLKRLRIPSSAQTAASPVHWGEAMHGQTSRVVCPLS